MKQGLFFIPVVVNALRQQNPEAALSEAFAQIEEMGREPDWEMQMGYTQFLEFMAHVRRSERPAEEDSLARPASLELVLEREDVVVARIPIGSACGCLAIGGITPGLYRLRQDTGWVLWQEQLSPSDVLERFLRAAAQTEEPAEPPAGEWVLLGGRLILRIRRGTEQGELELELKPLEAER